MQDVTHKDVANEKPPLPQEQCEEFLRLYIPVQLQVRAYIRVLIQGRGDVNDVFQETSLVLVQKFSTFRRDGDFLQWALGIARNQVLKFWRMQKRDRRVFSDLVVENLAIEAVEVAGELEVRQESLDECMQRLTSRQRDLLRLFYGQRQSAGSIAASWGRSVHSVYRALKVVRQSLFDCVELKLAEDR